MNNLLITGRPGVGKTTFITNLAGALAPLQPSGFITREIREAGIRTGFELIGLNGSRRLLAHRETRSRFRVGRYGVDVPGFQTFLASLDLERHRSRPVIIDEIGKMECLSPLFRELVIRVLDEDTLFIATIAQNGTAFIESIKKRQDVVLVELTNENRDRLIEPVLRTIHSFRSDSPFR